MRPTVLLATAMDWPFPARLAAAFADCGARVEVLCPRTSPLTQTRHAARLHGYHPLAAAACLARAVDQARPALTIPCDDLTAALLATPLPSQDVLDRAARAGAPVAQSLPITDEATLEEAIAGFGLPLVLKQDGSWGGEGVRIARAREEARAAWRALRKPARLRDAARALRRRQSWFLARAMHPLPGRISAQRFIAGLPATSSIACWRGELVGALHFDVRASAEQTGPASVVTRTDCPQMQAAARAIAAALGLSGLFGLDYIRDAQGKVHLLEMNARATPTSHLALDQDLPASLLGAAGLGGWPRPPVTAKHEIALFPGEWLRDPSSPWLKDAFHDVPWDDPGVVRSLLRGMPAPAARALLEARPQAALTGKTALFRA